MQEWAPKRRASKARFLKLVIATAGLLAFAFAIARLLYWMIAI